MEILLKTELTRNIHQPATVASDLDCNFGIPTAVSWCEGSIKTITNQSGFAIRSCQITRDHLSAHAITHTWEDCKLNDNYKGCNSCVRSWGLMNNGVFSCLLALPCVLCHLRAWPGVFLVTSGRQPCNVGQWWLAWQCENQLSGVGSCLLWLVHSGSCPIDWQTCKQQWFRV